MCEVMVQGHIGQGGADTWWGGGGGGLGAHGGDVVAGVPCGLGSLCHSHPPHAICCVVATSARLFFTQMKKRVDYPNRGTCGLRHSYNCNSKSPRLGRVAILHEPSTRTSNAAIPQGR